MNYMGGNWYTFRYVEGGMGSVSKAIGSAATEAGATIVTDAEVYHFGITSVLLCDQMVLFSRNWS